MFNDEAQEPVSFVSSWKIKRAVQDSCSQTSEIITNDADTQVVSKTEVEIQTEKEEEKSQKIIEEDNSQELLGFLLKVYPIITTELESNSRSHAFDGYEVDWEEKSSSVQCLYSLIHAALEEKLEVTCLSWNPTGAVLAVAYGRYDHQDWCTHKSALCTWNLDRRSLNANKADLVIDVPSCLMSIAFHPVMPSLIVGGTFNGDIYVNDISRQDDTVIAWSGVGENSHKDPISQVTWLNEVTKDKKYKIMSAGGDGKILLWRLSLSSKSLKLLSAFVVQTDSIPRSLRVSKARADSMIGVTCLSFSHEDKTTFIAGSEGGGIFKCSLNATGTAASEDIHSVPVYSPVTFAFHPYLGPLHSVSCSPHHRNLFLTSGTDTITLYNMLQSKPALTIEPSTGYLYSVRWSYTRPVVFAVASANGKVLLYDLKLFHDEGLVHVLGLNLNLSEDLLSPHNVKDDTHLTSNRINPVMTLDGCASGSSVFATEFNPVRKHLLASGNGRGEVRVWKLNDELVSRKQRDEDVLESLAMLQME